MTDTGYDLSAFKLPPAKGQPAPQSGNSLSSAPDSSSRGYDLSAFNLPSHGAQSTAAKQKPAPTAKETPTFAPLTGSNPGNSSRGYDLSSFKLDEQIEVPQRTLDGSTATATIHVKDFGKTVRQQVSDALDYGSPESGLTALYWAIGVAKGAGLMDKHTLERFEKLGADFANAKDRKAFFRQSITPFLRGLTVGKRGK